MGRGRGRADEEEFLGVGRFEVLVAGGDGGGFAEVDAACVAEDRLTVEGGADGDGGFGGVEGDDEAAERF